MQRKVTIVVDLGFGDAGKGSIVDHLARSGEVSAVVRFNGGAQAAHNVITPDGRHHAFAQFGSGTFVPTVHSHLSRFALSDPEVIRDEARALERVGCENPLARLSIHEDSIIVTPFHKSLNILREIVRGKNRHGTCGMGIGECMRQNLAHPDEVIRAGDLANRRHFMRKIQQQHERFLDESKPIVEVVSPDVLKRYFAGLDRPDFPAYWSDVMTAFAEKVTFCDDDYLRRLADEGNLIFEGAQGVLLDEWYGFHPHTTWSTTTFDNALALLQSIGYDGAIEKLGVLRAYHVRHGQGPFPTEELQLSRMVPDAHNDAQGWQGEFRVGWLDTVLARYALDVCKGVDSMAITNIDRLAIIPRWKIARAYAINGLELTDLVAKTQSKMTDLAYQERLTKLLMNATPLYHEDPNLDDPNKYIGMIEDYLGSPVTLESHGPTALDKRQRISRRLTV